MLGLGTFLEKTGLKSLGKFGKKKTNEYLKTDNHNADIDASEAAAIALTVEEVAFTEVESGSVQNFLDVSFGVLGRYVPNRSPKIFEHQGKSYMAIWCNDTQLNKKQFLVFIYEDDQRKMIASVGYTNDLTDYDLKMSATPFAILVNGEKLTTGKSETAGTDDVTLVLA
jgi:hypothetical protein